MPSRDVRCARHKKFSANSSIEVAFPKVLLETIAFNNGPGALPGAARSSFQAVIPFLERSPPQRNANMAQIFHRSTNFISRFSLFSAIFFAGLVLTLLMGFTRTSYFTRQNVSTEQPVQFSHKHHVGDDGIDCRYCHTGVETSATAGIPPTKTCMNCHSVLFNNAGYLEPVRESYRTDKSIEWVRVHRLADYVYFNHSIHVNKGVGCSSCHGQVNQMPLVFQAGSLLMHWCLDCHRNPEAVLRENPEDVFNMNWKAPDNQEEIGKRLAKERNLRTTAELTSCSTCHR